MRFPQSPLTADVFRLFNKINIMDKVIPYHFTRGTNLLYFNGVQRRRDDATIPHPESFDIYNVPQPWASVGWEQLVEYAVKPFKDALVKDNNEGTNEGWKLLMR